MGRQEERQEMAVISGDGIFSHVFIGANDVAASARFYDAALGRWGSAIWARSAMAGSSMAGKSRPSSSPVPAMANRHRAMA
jgi:hypothetical protein